MQPVTSGASRYATRLAKWRPAPLDATERVDAGLPVLIPGALAGAGLGAAGAIGGPARWFGARKIIGPPAPPPVGLFPVPVKINMVFALTERRLLVWKMSSWRNRPTRFLGEIPRPDIVRASYRKARVGAAKVGRLTIETADGSKTTFECVRRYVPDAQAFVAALEA